MNEIQILRRLATVADRHVAPRLDVAQRVLLEIAVRKAENSRVLATLAAVASAAAAISVAFAWEELSSLLDPLNHLFDAVLMVLR